MIIAPGVGLIAWVPVLDPLNVFHDWWWLLALPLSLGIAMIYKALRLPTLAVYWRQVAIMTAQIVLGMIALAAALNLLVQHVIPLLPAD